MWLDVADTYVLMTGGMENWPVSGNSHTGSQDKALTTFTLTLQKITSQRNSNKLISPTEENSFSFTTITPVFQYLPSFGLQVFQCTTLTMLFWTITKTFNSPRCFRRPQLHSLRPKPEYTNESVNLWKIYPPGSIRTYSVTDWSLH